MATVEQRLINFRLIDQDTGCWLFTGHIDSSGYGMIGFFGGPERAHRVAAILWLDYEPGETTPDGDELCVLHTHGGNRHCFNPEHLYISTKRQNSKDRERDGTAFNHWQTKLEENDVIEILTKHENGASMRSIARDYSVDYRTIYAIINGMTWKHIERNVGLRQ